MHGVYELLDRLLPEACPGCRGPSGGGYCVSCREELDWIADPCPRCALPRPVSACPASGTAWALDRTVAPLAFSFPLDRAIHALKFRHARALGRALGLLLAERLAEQALGATGLIPVPLHPSRLRERGYNQALEIARPISRLLGVRIQVAGVVRRAPTAPQLGLTPSQRARNLAGAFSITADLRGQKLAVIDDVLTTAATANALACALRGAGAKEVHAWAVARALPPRRHPRSDIKARADGSDLARAGSACPYGTGGGFAKPSPPACAPPAANGPEPTAGA